MFLFPYTLHTNPETRKRRSRAELSVVASNDFVPLKLSIRVDFDMPGSMLGMVSSSKDVLRVVREFYEELPYSLRHRDPLNGELVFKTVTPNALGSFRAVATPCVQSFQPSSMHDIADMLRDAEIAMAAFCNPWWDAGWRTLHHVELLFRRGEPLPEWLVEGCKKARFQLVEDDHARGRGVNA